MTEYAIRADALAKSFGPTQALRDVSLRVPAGSVCALLGRNGAGKTTTVRILTTLIRPDAGHAEVAGFDVTRDPARVRARIGMAGQSATMDELLTGQQNLDIIGRMYHLGPARSQRRAGELLDQFGLTAAAGRMVKTYSGGMRRRLDLAASLVADPPVLFLDEPTSGLDPVSRAAMWQAIRDLVAAGTTVLLTTQHLEEADHLANEIVVISDGVVAAAGTPAQLTAAAGQARLRVTLAEARPPSWPGSRRPWAREPGPTGAGLPRPHRTGWPAWPPRSPGWKGPAPPSTRPVWSTPPWTRCSGGSPARPGRKAKTVPGPATADPADWRPPHHDRPDRRTPHPASRARFALADAVTATRRYLLRSMRQPDIVIGGLLMPIVFVLLFGYVFGSSIHVPGGNYRAYLMSGLFAQATLFSSAAVSVAVATDMSEGVIDRFKVLPIARSSVLIGRTVSTVITGLPSTAVMITCALVVGWRAENGLGDAVAGFAVLALFGFAMGWVGVVIGLYVKSPQSADVFAMVPSFLLGFVSNVFVNTANMPAWLRVFANWNPMSAVVVASRTLFGTSQGVPEPSVWSLQHPVVTTLGMSVILLGVMVPLGLRRYSRAVR